MDGRRSPLLSRRKARASAPPQSTVKTMMMADTPLGVTSKVTVERRGQIVLIGINRPYIQNRVDPETYLGLAKAYYQYEHDASLRAAVLFGHGDNFSRGIDVDAFQALAASGRPFLPTRKSLILCQRQKGCRSRWWWSSTATRGIWGTSFTLSPTYELLPPTRASARTRTRTAAFRAAALQSVSYVKRDGRNAMRYMLTGDHWSAEEALRMGVVQRIAPTADAALEAGVETATKIAACGPLGIKATWLPRIWRSIRRRPKPCRNWNAQYRALYGSEDFKEGRKAEAEGRLARLSGTMIDAASDLRVCAWGPMTGVDDNDRAPP